jgi:hypothetical protein
MGVTPMWRGAAVAACVLALTAAVNGDERPLLYQSIDVPGATFTTAQGINSHGEIVGWYINGSGAHGYLLAGC